MSICVHAYWYALHILVNHGWNFAGSMDGWLLL
jgi:hypothetical protein